MARKRRGGTSPTKPPNEGNAAKKKKDGAGTLAGLSVGTSADASVGSSVGTSAGSSGATSSSKSSTIRDDEMDSSSELDDDNSQITAEQQKKKKEKLPPLVVRGVPLQQLTRDVAKLGVTAEYEMRGVGIKVFLRSRADYELVATTLAKAKTEYYTHDIPADKPFKVVVRGLPNYDPKLIRSELKERYKLVPVAIYRIRRKDEDQKQYPYCLFLVHFKKGTVTLNSLKAVRCLFHVRIRWEAYRGGRRDVTQCQRCLHFGHGTRNCNIKPRCNLCALNHPTAECPNNGAEAEAPAVKCANCGGDHQGNDRKCPKREEFKQVRKLASQNQPNRKKNKPSSEITQKEFPPLNTTLASKPMPMSKPTPALTKTTPPTPLFSEIVERGTPTPPPGKRSSSENEASDLFPREELEDIFDKMTEALRGCRSKPEQIQVLGKFIIRYAYGY